MNKTLQKAVMNRSRLRNRFLKNKTDENKIAYTKQRNFCVSLFRKEKKKYYYNLNPKKIADNKKFWKTVKPFLSEKGCIKEKITLIENEKIINNEEEIAETFNNFFSNIIPNLDIPRNDYNHVVPDGKNTSPVSSAIAKYAQHPSIY